MDLISWGVVTPYLEEAVVVLISSVLVAVKGYFNKRKEQKEVLEVMHKSDTKNEDFSEIAKGLGKKAAQSVLKSLLTKK